jgi:CRISPR-associated endonuclease/helicase Cas3
MNSEARLFNAPLTITTVDQIFRFVFRYHGYEMIPATLMYSKVIIDEIQMYTPSIIACILYGLREIHRLGGKFLIMTATMPGIFIKILKENLKMDVLEPFLRESNRKDKAKHFVKLLHTSVDIEIIEEEAQNNKVLVIVNTVAKAQEIYEQINTDNKWLIHSLYTKEHRNILENAIMEFTRDPEAKGVWVSTQIVEASLDIDFDILHSEMCTIDSLFQRMGRILRGRNRFLKDSQPNIKVYTKEETGVGYVIDPEIYQFSLRALKKALAPEDQMVLTEEDKQSIICNVYDPDINPEILESNYYKSITTYIDEYLKSIQTKPYELKKSEVLFRNILSDLVIPRNIYDELDRSGELLRMEQELQKADSRQKIFDEILKYTIQVSHFYDKNLLYYSGSELLIEAGKRAYSENGIKICECPYEFDVNDKRGLGLKKKISIEEKNKLQTENSII